MKLKEGFITHTMGSEHIMVAAGPAAKVFHGLVRSNSTAGMIIEQLKSETDIDTITKVLAEQYDAPDEKIRADVESIVSTLRSIGAIEE